MNNKHQFSVVGDGSIFRYLSYDKFESLIESSALFFSRMDLMSDPNEGTLYKSGGETNMVYGSCWRLQDLGNYKDLFKQYECGEDGVIIKTSIASLRDAFYIFATSRHHSVHWGLFFPYVIFTKVNYTDKNCEEIDIDTDDLEIMVSQLCYNVDEHLLPFLLKKKDYENEQELRIFTRWQSMTMNGPSFLSECAIFKKYTGERIKRRCTCRADIFSIEKEIKKGEVLSITDIDQMQPIGFFYPISLKIIEAIYTQSSAENKIKNLLDKSNYSYLSNKLKVL